MRPPGVDVGDGTYLVVELQPRREAQFIGANGGVTAHLVEASAKIHTGPAAYPLTIFDVKVLRRCGWALLSASHRLQRLQGEEPTADEGDPQLPFGTEIDIAS